MKRHLIVSAMVLALLSACGNDDDDDNTAGDAGEVSLSVDDLGTGAHVVAMGSANDPVVGKYYGGDDGSRLLLVANSEDAAIEVFRRDGQGSWVSVPASTENRDVHFLRSNTALTSDVAADDLKGSYIVRLPSGETARFSLGDQGAIAAGDSACKISGALSSSALPNSLGLTLSTSACSHLPAQASGVLTLDPDYAPAAFRMVADDGTQIAELWAYKQP